MVACALDASHCASVQLRVDCTATHCLRPPPKASEAAGPELAPVPLVDDAAQNAAVEGLLQRLLPNHAHVFRCSIHPNSTGFFSVQVHAGRVYVEGATGVDVASGINWFLKNYADSSVTWEVTGGAQINHAVFSRLHELEPHGKVTVERSYPFSYYQNIVTLSYSMAYWDWDRWEQEIDLMALQGINLPLAPVGMEFIWVETYKQLGLSPADLQDFFPGPSFLAWGRMGNIQGWGGPLPMAYIQKQAQLQVKILERMRSLGMAPVLPAFAGFVPRAVVEKHPEAEVTQISRWCHFADPYCCPYILAPTDPLFHTIGTTFIRTLRHHYGNDAVGYYAADCFNEMRPASAAPDYLSRMSQSVFKAMADADPSSVWIMQAWLFFSDPQFWQPPQVQALLKGVPRGRLLLLDLFAEEHPLWERTAAFQGYPFIWCMLHNFGGNLELYGALPSVTAGLRRAAASAPAGLVGVGMAPEGLEQNPIVYQFMAEHAFRAGPEQGAGAGVGGMLGSGDGDQGAEDARRLREWARRYATRRYGGAALLDPPPSLSPPPSPDASPAALLQDAWQLLASTAYSCTDRSRSTVRDVPTSRPGLSRTEIIGWGLAPHLWYDLRHLVHAWRLLLSAASAPLPPTPSSTPAPVPSSPAATPPPPPPTSLAAVPSTDDVVSMDTTATTGPPSEASSPSRSAPPSPSPYDDAAAARAAARATIRDGAASGTTATTEPADLMASSSSSISTDDAEPLLAEAAASEAAAGGAEAAWPAAAAGGAAARLAANAAFRYDVVDVSREVLSKAATGVWLEVVRAYTARDAGALAAAAAQLLELLDDLDALLGSHKSFMLGPWLQHVRAYADTEEEARLYEWNARTQITIWGTSASGDSEVSDYANREWAGLISTFYRPRWAHWLQRLQADLAGGLPYDAEAAQQEALGFTLLWPTTPLAVPTAPSGDPLLLSASMYTKYAALVDRLSGGPLPQQ